MRNVLFFCNSLYGGGAEKVFQTLVKNLNKDNYNITLYGLIEENIGDFYPANLHYRYIFNKEKETDGPLRRFCVKCKNKIKLLVYYNCSAKFFYRLFVKGTYDVEVAFIEGYATRILSGSSNDKSLKIAWVHTDLSANRWTKVAYRTLAEESETYQRFNHVVCVSNFVAKQIKGLFPMLNSIRVIYNPIDSKEIVGKSQEL